MQEKYFELAMGFCMKYICTSYILVAVSQQFEMFSKFLFLDEIRKTLLLYRKQMRLHNNFESILSQ